MSSSHISLRKLITSFSLVCFVLSIPIFYLLYANYVDYKNRYETTLLELKGGNIIGHLLSDFSVLSLNKQMQGFEERKKENKDEIITQNILNLKRSQLRDAENFFLERQSVSNSMLAQEYYLPLINFIATRSNLILDPDPDSYYFMDILVLRIPVIYALLANMDGEETQKKILRDIKLHLSEIDRSLKVAIRENKDIASRPKLNIPHVENFRLIAEEVDAQIAGIRDFNPSAVTVRFQHFEKDIRHELSEILKHRNFILKKDKNFILFSTLTFWFFGIISGYFLFVKVLEKHAQILELYIDQSKHLIESEKLSFVGEIASAIAHEVKNPLTVIDFEAASVRKNLSSDHYDKEKAMNRLTKISEMSFRINKISNLITVFTRKSENDPFEIVPFKKIMEDTIYLTQLKASARGIPIEVSALDCDLSCRVLQLEQVYINLVNNALDAVLNLSEQWVKIIPTLEKRDGEDWIIVKVVDSGPGIKKEVAENMFNSFFTTKESGKGTGLGLSIAQRIVEDHRGKIYYDQTAEHTTFVVEIPRFQPSVLK